MASSSVGLDPVPGQGNQPWPVFIEGDELAQLRNKYNEVNDDDWDSIVQTAADILCRCPSPSGPDKADTGLAIGKVQSGKTLSYSALTALAFDNGYAIVIVLAGTKNPLLDQTYVRLSRDLVGSRTTITPFKNPTVADSDVIESVLHTGRHALMVSLKRQNRVSSMQEIFDQPSLGGHTVLLIDDEGDEASLNTQFKKGRQSAVYRSILSLRSSLRRHAYIAYTATPQANLLIDGIDSLSPDFGNLVYPGQGYCGGSLFFGDRIDEFVREIPVDEAEASSGTITATLSRAVATFLVGAAIRHRREERDWHSMLIHNSSLTLEHSQAHKSVKDLINSWRDKLNLNDSDPEKQSLLALFQAAYNDLAGTVQSIPSWDYLKGDLASEIWQVEVWMVNSLPRGRDPMSTPIRLPNNIFVGGNMLGRGLTISGLAVTYITRRARNDTNADTLEQRARWFGYKSSYLDVCRIFLTSTLRTNYIELLRHEDDFWDALSRNMMQGIHIRNWPRMFRLDSDIGLNPTRANIAYFRRFRGSGWDSQRALVETPAIANSNVEYVESFFSRHHAIPKFYGSIEHLAIDNCPTEAVISELLENVNTEGTDWENSYTKEYLTRLLLSGRLPTMEVLLMRKGVKEDRTKTNGRVNPFSGRSNNYEGDQYIHGDKVQFQVHIIAPREKEEDPTTVITTSFGLYIPLNNQLYNLAYVVRGRENGPEQSL